MKSNRDAKGRFQRRQQEISAEPLADEIRKAYGDAYMAGFQGAVITAAEQRGREDGVHDGIHIAEQLIEDAFSEE